MTKKEIGKLIQNKRKTLGLTQQKLADQIGYERTSLQKVETGKRAPSPKMAALLSDSLHIPVQDLLDSPLTEEQIMANKVEKITRTVNDKKSKRAIGRMEIIENLFLLHDDELPAVNDYIKTLMREHGGVRHYESIFNADAHPDPNATYTAPTDQ